MKEARSLLEQFEDSYVPCPMSGCWLWVGRTTYAGYGQLTIERIKIEGRWREIRIYAHRFSWELHKGPIPPEINVLHRCDVTSCVNPDHLFLGTMADNSADMVAKGRSRHGEAHYCAKLTEADIRAIRSAEGMTQRELADLYGVRQDTIHHVLQRHTWKHLQ